MTGKELETQLEAIVDASSMSAVLGALGEIAYAKAEHLRANWQDEAAAKLWDQAGKKLDQYMVTIDNLIG